MTENMPHEELLERLKESLADYFTGDPTKTDCVDGLVGVTSACVWISDEIFEAIRGSEAFSTESLIETIEEATGSKWSEWKYNIDMRGGYYYLPIEAKSND